MAVTSFDVDERTAALITQLRGTFGVKTNAAVIRKALALANVASQHADSDHMITIGPSEGKPAVKVSLAEVISRRTKATQTLPLSPEHFQQRLQEPRRLPGRGNSGLAT